MVSRTELKIRKTLFIPADSLDQVMHLEHLHIEVAQSADGESALESPCGEHFPQVKLVEVIKGEDSSEAV